MTHNTKQTVSKSLMLNCFIMIMSTLITLNTAQAGGRFKAKGTKTNAAGGVTSVRAAGASGQNGGGFMRARGSTTNGQGQATGGGATAVKGANGGKGFRAGSYTADSSGNVNYSGAAAATGANGSAATTGGFSRGSDGSIRGSRSTTATANNGNSYSGNTTYDNNGVSHTQNCYNASGQEIKCPTKN